MYFLIINRDHRCIVSVVVSNLTHFPSFILYRIEDHFLKTLFLLNA